MCIRDSIERGKTLGLKPFGIRAMDALRLEKSYRLVGTELSIEYSAHESGLNRFIYQNKGDFVGRDALAAWQKKGFRNAFVTLEVHDTKDADAIGNNAIFKNGVNVGRATSGGFGFRVNKSLALGMVRPDLGDAGTELDMDILGRIHRVTVIEESPYDPSNTKLQS